MLLEEKINDLQNLTKRKITYDELAQILGVGTANALRNWNYRKRHLKEYEIKKIDDAILNYSTELNNVSQNNEDYIEVEHIHINPSCGTGTVVLDEPDITPVKLGKKMIETRKLENLYSFRRQYDRYNRR